MSSNGGIRRPITSRPVAEPSRKLAGRTPLSARVREKQSHSNDHKTAEKPKAQSHGAMEMGWSAPRSARDFLFDGSRGVQGAQADGGTARYMRDYQGEAGSHIFDPLMLKAHRAQGLRLQTVGAHEFPHGIHADMEKAFLHSKVTELEMRLQHSLPLNAALQERDEAISGRGREREEYEARIVALEQRVARYKEAKSRLAGVQEKVKEKSGLISTLQDQVSGLEAECEKQTNARRESERTSEAASKQHNVLLQQLESEGKERETALAMALQEQHRCNAALQDQVRLLGEEQRSVGSSLATLQVALREARESKERELRDQKEEFEGRLKFAEGERERTETARKSLLRRVEAMEEEVEAAERMLGGIEKEMARVGLSVETARQRAEEREEERGGMVEEGKAMREGRERAEGMVRAGERKRREEREEAAGEMRAMEREMEGLKEEARVRSVECARARMELEEERQRARAEGLRAATQIAQLRENGEEMEGRAKVLLRDHAAMEEEKSKLEAAVQILRNEETILAVRDEARDLAERLHQVVASRSWAGEERDRLVLGLEAALQGGRRQVHRMESEVARLQGLYSAGAKLVEETVSWYEGELDRLRAEREGREAALRERLFVAEEQLSAARDSLRLRPQPQQEPESPLSLPPRSPLRVRQTASVA